MNATLRTPMLIGSWSLPETTGLDGALAGALTGAVTLLLSPILFALHGMSAWTIPQRLAAMVVSEGALGLFGLTPLLIGALLYLGVSVVLGACFGLVYRRALRLTTEFGLPLYVGLVYGLLLFMATYFGVLPTIDPSLTAGDAAMGPTMALTTIFGMGLGVCYSIIRPAPYSEAAAR